MPESSWKDLARFCTAHNTMSVLQSFVQVVFGIRSPSAKPDVQNAPPRATVEHPTGKTLVMILLPTRSAASTERKRQQLSLLEDARERALRSSGVLDQPRKKKTHGGPSESASAPAFAEKPNNASEQQKQEQQSQRPGSTVQTDLSSDAQSTAVAGERLSDADTERRLLEGRAEVPDDLVDVGGSGGDESVGNSGVGVRGGRAPRETKAVARGRHAGHSEKVLAERMAHLLSQRCSNAHVRLETLRK